MTLYVRIGRRVPKNWMKRQIYKMQGLLSFQENLWIMINQSFNLARRRCIATSKPKMVFEILKKQESESIRYNLEWIVIVVQGLPEQEKEEHQEIQSLNEQLVKRFTSAQIPDSAMENDELKKVFKTKILTPEKLKKVFEAGHQQTAQSSIAAKLLEMGIITDIELVEDYNTRDEVKTVSSDSY